jgi:DNA-directed RNA polymerase subunit RPC12/RpoP
MLEKNDECISTKDTRYRCKFCGKFYSSSHSLKTHEKWHTGDLKHKCTFCEKKFRNPSEVKRHEMTHTGERPNKCPHCKMKFIQKTSLREHIEKKHQSDCPSPDLSENLSCKYCQKIFEDKESLSVHEENEAKEFEALHESFEQGEFRELENFSLQDYLPQGIAEVNGAFNEQLKEEQLNFTSPTSILAESFTILSERPSNNNDINFEISDEKNSQARDLGTEPKDASSLDNIKLPETVPVSQQLSFSSSISCDNKQSQEVPASNMTKSPRIKEELFPFSFPENFLSEPVVKTEENKTKETSEYLKTELQSYECKLEPPDAIDMDYSESTHLTRDIKEEDKVDEITQFFEELEGQYPHLKTELVDSIQMPLYQTSGDPSMLRPSSIKSDSESVTSSDSPRYTGASTPVDTIQASSLTQPSPPSYHSQVLSPLPTSSVPSPEIQSLSVPEMVINSTFLAPSEPIPPVIHIAPLRNSTNQATTLPSQGLPTSTNSNQFFPPQSQYYPSTESVPALSYQDELNVFCEGILNQIECSNWTDININNDFQEIQSSSSTSTVSNPQIQANQISTGFSPHHLAYKTNLVSTSMQNNNISQVSHDKNATQMQSDSNEKWITDRSSIPNGWRMKIVDTIVGARPIKKSQFLSPSGQFFDSRKSALDHMIRTMAYSTEDIETMKKGLRNKTKFEWESGRDGVPNGWKTREKLSSDGKVRIFYLSPGGISFPCRLAAYEHMVKDGAYRQQDIEMMKVGAKSKRNRGKDFTEGDPTVPPGWKIRVNAQMKESFRSPSGVFFSQPSDRPGPYSQGRVSTSLH